MAQRAKAILGVDTLDVLADRGYYDGQQIKRCLTDGITPWVPKPLTSANAKHGLFTKEDFQYDAERDLYRCPQGAELTFRFQTVEAGRDIRYYTTAACRTCPIKARCTRNKRSRRITRWVEEQLLEEMAARIRANPERTKQRKSLVEHPFGTMKRGMRQHDFFLRSKAKVAAEMSLTVLAYNLRRVLTILGSTSLVENFRAASLAVLQRLLRTILLRSYHERGRQYLSNQTTDILLVSRPSFHTVSALVGLPNRGSTALQSGKYSQGMPPACHGGWHPLLGVPASCPNRRSLPPPLCHLSRFQASIVVEAVILSLACPVRISGRCYAP